MNVAAQAEEPYLIGMKRLESYMDCTNVSFRLVSSQQTTQ